MNCFQMLKEFYDHLHASVSMLTRGALCILWLSSISFCMSASCSNAASSGSMVTLRSRSSSFCSSLMECSRQACSMTDGGSEYQSKQMVCVLVASTYTMFSGWAAAPLVRPFMPSAYANPLVLMHIKALQVDRVVTQHMQHKKWHRQPHLHAARMANTSQQPSPFSSPGCRAHL